MIASFGTLTLTRRVKVPKLAIMESSVPHTGSERSLTGWPGDEN
jgi:hypothetical protein